MDDAKYIIDAEFKEYAEKRIKDKFSQEAQEIIKKMSARFATLIREEENETR